MPLTTRSAAHLLDSIGASPYGISIAVIDRSGHLDTATTGMADASTGRPLHPDALLHACSMSKFVAAVAVTALADQGLVSLDAAANDCLDGWTLRARDGAVASATVAQLLSHTSGIGDLPADGMPLAPGVAPSLASLVSGDATRDGREVTVDQGAAGLFDYSDAGFWVVERIVADVTGEPYSQAVASLLGPIHGGGAWAWSYDDRPAHRRDELPGGVVGDDAARGHGSDGTVIPGGRPTYAGLAAAGLWCTPSHFAELLADVARAWRGQPAQTLTQSGARELSRDWTDGDGVGLGCFVFDSRAGMVVQTHGWGEGFQTIARVHPETGSVMVAMMCADPGVPQSESVLGELARTWLAGIE